LKPGRLGALRRPDCFVFVVYSPDNIGVLFAVAFISFLVTAGHRITVGRRTRGHIHGKFEKIHHSLMERRRDTDILKKMLQNVFVYMSISERHR
jgi:hypothetical protein